jgi:diguanylate cyclase (GGDEF)-like protein
MKPEDVERELRARQRYLARLNDITRASLEAVDLKTMLQTLADQLGELFDADGCYITLWDETTRTVLPSAAYGPLRDIYPTLQVTPDEPSLTSVVLRERRAVIVNDVHKSPIINQRIAQSLPTISMLGLPLIVGAQKLGAALIASNTPNRFSDEDITRGEQAAGQIALAIAKTLSLEIEQQRAAQLARANKFITALSNIAAHIETAPNPEGVMEALGAELKQLGLHCIVILRESNTDDLTIRYISLDPSIQTFLSWLLGFKQPEIRFSRTSFLFYDDVIEQQRTLYITDPLPIIQHLLPNLRPAILEILMRTLGLTTQITSLYLPLAVGDKVRGMLMLWGEGLQEDDITATSIFANQVAITLENARLYAEVQQLAITDVLLEIYNRRGLFTLGAREVERAQRLQRPLSALILDLDFFKKVNDTYSHAVGDEVLHEVAQRCRTNIRGIDLIGRYGGEEFAVLLPETDLAVARIIAERLRAAIANTPIATQRRGGVTVTISLGAAALTASTPDLATLLHYADEALYAAKRRGRNRVEIKV